MSPFSFFGAILLASILLFFLNLIQVPYSKFGYWLFIPFGYLFASEKEEKERIVYDCTLEVEKWIAERFIKEYMLPKSAEDPVLNFVKIRWHFPSPKTNLEKGVWNILGWEMVFENDKKYFTTVQETFYNFYITFVNDSSHYGFVTPILTIYFVHLWLKDHKIPEELFVTNEELTNIALKSKMFWKFWYKHGVKTFLEKDLTLNDVRFLREFLPLSRGFEEFDDDGWEIKIWSHLEGAESIIEDLYLEEASKKEQDLKEIPLRFMMSE